MVVVVVVVAGMTNPKLKESRALKVAPLILGQKKSSAHEAKKRNRSWMMNYRPEVGIILVHLLGIMASGFTIN